MLMIFSENYSRLLVYANIIAITLAHFPHAVGAHQQGHGQDALAFLAHNAPAGCGPSAN